MTDKVAWAACLPAGDALALGSLRTAPAVTCTVADGVLWVRGSDLDHVDVALRRVPGLRRFVVDGERLVPVGRRVPVATLPSGAWQPLAEWLVPAAGVAAHPARPPAPCPLQVVRGGEEREAGALTLDLATFVAWCLETPRARLDPLRFAVSDEDRVLVIGRPLPPLPGRRWSIRGGVLTPCGFAWSPPVDEAVLRTLFRLDADDVVLLTEDGAARIPAERFVRASRAAARATSERSTDG